MMRSQGAHGSQLTTLHVISIATLLRAFPNSGTWDALGTAFSFRSQSHFVTAAHCVDALEPDQISVVGVFSQQRLVTARRVIRHPEADIAILVFDPTQFDTQPLLIPFDSVDCQHTVGMDVDTLGYPIDVFGPRPTFPTLRYMKGHIQRYVKHDGRRELPTKGIELSFFTDEGMSGAPVFRHGHSKSVIGMVISNVASSIPSEQIEEHLDGDRYSRVVYRNILRFGVALTLDRVENWLNEQVWQDSS
jgi:hypothetical protein